MTRTDPELVAVSRRINAPADEIFAILVSPRAHVDLDGSDMVRGALTAEPVSGVGDIFVIEMFFAGIGSYEMKNHIVEFELDRRIAWEPEAGQGHPDADSPAARWGHRWAYDLVPDGPDATVVTESYDCSAAPVEEREAMNDGRMWLDAMTATLERLDELCTGRPAASE